MKRSLLTLIVLSSIYFPATSQTVEVSLMSGYQFFGTASSNEGELNVDDHVNFLASIQYNPSVKAGFQLLYLVEPTSFTLQKWGEYDKKKLDDINIHYIMAGGSYNLNPEATVVIYGGGLVGAAIFAPVSSKYDTFTRMAFGLDGGLKGSLSDVVGLKLQGTFLIPVQFTGGGIFCGGSGCSAGVTSGTTFLQLGVDAGVTFTF